MLRDFRDWWRRLDLSQIRLSDFSPNRLTEKRWFLPTLVAIMCLSVLVALASVVSALRPDVRQPQVRLTAEHRLAASLVEELHAANQEFQYIEAWPSLEDPKEIVLVGKVFKEDALFDLEDWLQSRQLPYPVKIQVVNLDPDREFEPDSGAD